MEGVLSVVRNLFKRAQQVLKSRRGFIEIVAVVLLLIFIVLKVAPPVKDVGDTSKEAVDNLNDQLRIELNLGN